MNTMLHLTRTRSTVLADARLGHVGHADRANGHAAVLTRVGAPIFELQRNSRTQAPTTTLHATIPEDEKSEKTTTVVTTETTETRRGHDLVDFLGGGGSLALLAAVVVGPLAVGYLVGGKVGVLVGAVVAAPVAVLLGLAILDKLPKPNPS